VIVFQNNFIFSFFLIKNRTSKDEDPSSL